MGLWVNINGPFAPCLFFSHDLSFYMTLNVSHSINLGHNWSHCSLKTQETKCPMTSGPCCFQIYVAGCYDQCWELRVKASPGQVLWSFVTGIYLGDKHDRTPQGQCAGFCCLKLEWCDPWPPFKLSHPSLNFGEPPFIFRGVDHLFQEVVHSQGSEVESGVVIELAEGCYVLGAGPWINPADACRPTVDPLQALSEKWTWT